MLDKLTPEMIAAKLRYLPVGARRKALDTLLASLSLSKKERNKIEKDAGIQEALKSAPEDGKPFEDGKEVPALGRLIRRVPSYFIAFEAKENDRIIALLLDRDYFDEGSKQFNYTDWYVLVYEDKENYNEWRKRVVPRPSWHVLLVLLIPFLVLFGVTVAKNFMFGDMPGTPVDKPDIGPDMPDMPDMPDTPPDVSDIGPGMPDMEPCDAETTKKLVELKKDIIGKFKPSDADKAYKIIEDEHFDYFMTEKWPIKAYKSNLIEDEAFGKRITNDAASNLLSYIVNLNSALKEAKKCKGKLDIDLTRGRRRLTQFMDRRFIESKPSPATCVMMSSMLADDYVKLLWPGGEKGKKWKSNCKDILDRITCVDNSKDPNSIDEAYFDAKCECQKSKNECLEPAERLLKYLNKRAGKEPLPYTIENRRFVGVLSGASKKIKEAGCRDDHQMQNVSIKEKYCAFDFKRSKQLTDEMICHSKEVSALEREEICGEICLDEGSCDKCLHSADTAIELSKVLEKEARDSKSEDLEAEKKSIVDGKKQINRKIHSYYDTGCQGSDKNACCEKRDEFEKENNETGCGKANAEPCEFGDRCAQGFKVCDPGQDKPKLLCINTEINETHCGSCGNGCSPGSEICCDGDCVNKNVSLKHCGSCGNGCSPGQKCEEGKCVCSEGTIACGEICCEGGKTCQGGSCECPENQHFREADKKCVEEEIKAPQKPEQDPVEPNGEPDFGVTEQGDMEPSPADIGHQSR